ncbi:EamA family transporter [Desulfobulbus rhabdoformis]|uniref:SMR family transporter n=1 Tax=Desulfobulbus rhabdoformis TaxID=34032 RepID=UPI001964AB6F|nr:SMR family transporter [Desulfobulbus rhabdoformis]MBM9613561.1 EamA family transporter [Desulfobulbus rhabdoformis]
MAIYLPLILFGVLLNAAAQLALKQGMRQIGYFDFMLTNIPRIVWEVAANGYIWAGLICYVVSVVVWLLVLSRVEVSYAYPLLSVGYIVTACAGWFLFHENLSPTRLLGIAVICLGVYFITRSS